MAREIIALACSECKRRNYVTTKKRGGGSSTSRLKLRKYCKWCRRHTEHREVRLGR